MNKKSKKGVGATAKKTATPAEEAAKPVKKAAKPVKEAAKPVKKAAKPAKKAAKPVQKAANPAKKRAKKKAAVKKTTAASKRKKSAGKSADKALVKFDPLQRYLTEISQYSLLTREEERELGIRVMEHERKEAYGALTHHLESMSQAQQALQGETRNLVKALSRPEVRGQWGEMTLKRLAELAGMVEHCDFYEQEHTQTAEGALRPDMIVRMPGNREIVVDVKTPLDAYLSAVEATDEKERETHLLRHSKNVRKRVQELATKGYWNQFQHAPDFVVLFIPGDQFLSAALDNDHALIEDAMQKKVILATPTSFVALLRAVAYGWRHEALTENAEVIRQVGEELYGRLSTFADHLGRTGKSLNSSVQHFNKAVSSFNSRVIPGARKFTEMGISAKKDVESIEQIETVTRDPEPPQVLGEQTNNPKQHDDTKH